MNDDLASGSNHIIDADQRARDQISSQLGTTMFVEAGAGTGKTTALVGRIVNLVLSTDPNVRRPLSQIAAITFTEAAAAELRERIRIEFENALHDAQHAGAAELEDRCQQALADADVAAISTLHAFAQRLLSEFPVEVGVPPRVEVIDEVRSQLAFTRRWSSFLDELYDDSDLEEFIVRASILNVPLNGAAMRNIAQEFDDNWDRLLDVEVEQRAAVPIDFARVRNVIAGIRDLEVHCSDPSDSLLGRIGELQAVFERFERAGSDHERLRLLRALPEQKLGKSGRQGSWGGRDGVAAARETVVEINDACATIFETVASQTLTQLAGKVAEFTQRSAAERRAEGLLEFHDLLVLAHLLLRTSTEARVALSDRYRVLMLDEFQDTDPIQISLALLLASTVASGVFTGDWQDLTPEDGRIFMVGDPKQSIYRFRRADIALFLAARDRFSDGAVSLQRNFRTVAPVVEAVNALFAEIMAHDSAQQAKYSPLVPTRQPSSADHRPIVFGGPSADKARAVREVEASDVASIIADVIENPRDWLVDDENGGWREPQLQDITILLPTRTSMSQLSNALDDRSIPFRADTGTLVYETQEIKNLLSVLSAIDSPSDQIALVAALRSPLYACGDDDLYTWRTSGGVFDLRAPAPFGLDGHPVSEAIEHLSSLHDDRWWTEPSQLLLRVIDERFAMALPARGRRARDTWRRLRYVVDQARAFSEAGGGDLREYLEWTRLQGVDGSRAHEPMLPEPDDDAVHVMTIHGSKGLEFPITIVSGLTTELGRARPVRGEVLWGATGVLPEVKATSAARTSQFDLAKELDDEMDGPERERLLYVALTRARDHLAVSRHHRVSAKGDPITSHGASMANFANGQGESLVRPFVAQGSLFVTPSLLERSDRGFTEPRPPAEWRAWHHDVISRASRQRVVSATALAAASGANRSESDDWYAHAPEDDDVLVRDADTEHREPAINVAVFRRGRAGSAIGSAVHAALQVIDLTSPDTADIRSICASQAWVESVPEAIDTIESAVRSALAAPILQACSQARHWKELFVAVPIDDLTLEGYVDLLVETPEGLVVVDYKTDDVRSEADIDAKLERYSLQGAAYAVAVEVATGRTVIDVQFVFTRPGEPIVRSIENLADRCVDVRAAAGVLVAPPVSPSA